MRVERRQYVPFTVDSRVPAQRAELRSHPLRARQFMKCGSGDAANLQLDIVHPLLFLRKMLERLTHAAPFGKIADHIRSLQSLGCHKFSVATRKCRLMPTCGPEQPPVPGVGVLSLS